MSLLVIQLPPRDRLGARGTGPEMAGHVRLPSEWDFVLSADGRSVSQSGRAALALLPRADTVVLMLADADVSWHRIEVPKAPAARQRAALAGVMEEVLLDDDEALHLALGPGAAGGRSGWVAATHRPYLAAALAAKGYAKLTSVQEAVLNPGAAGRDLLVHSNPVPKIIANSAPASLIERYGGDGMPSQAKSS